MTKKVLFYGDYGCSTGFATVLGNIVREVAKTTDWDIEVIGINYTGDPIDHDKWPGRVWPAMPGIMSMSGPYADVYGRQRLLDLMGSGEYDAVFMIQDTFVIQSIIKEIKGTQEALKSYEDKKNFKTVFYFPIDATPKKEWAETAAAADFPVAYTNYARDEVAKHVKELADVPVIYHGTNLKDFYPIDNAAERKAFRDTYFGGKVQDDTFLIVNVNRNQPRKDTMRNLMLMRELLDRGHKDIHMYLHMQFDDQGGNIFEMMRHFGLTDDYVSLPSPQVFNANQGLPVEVVNHIYNAADVIFTPTLGEGWGLSVTEAMATKTPVVAPGITSLNEMMDNNRGIKLPTSDWIMKEGDNERIRPITDVKAAADAIEGIKDKTALPDIEGAFEWVQALSWESITRQWVEIIQQALDEAEKVKNVTKTDSQFLNRKQRRALKKGK